MSPFGILILKERYLGRPSTCGITRRAPQLILIGPLQSSTERCEELSLYVFMILFRFLQTHARSVQIIESRTTSSGTNVRKMRPSNACAAKRLRYHAVLVGERLGACMRGSRSSRPFVFRSIEGERVKIVQLNEDDIMLPLSFNLALQP